MRNYLIQIDGGAPFPVEFAHGFDAALWALDQFPGATRVSVRRAIDPEKLRADRIERRDDRLRAAMLPRGLPGEPL